MQETQIPGTQSLNIQRSIDIQAVKEFVGRLVQEETLEDIREGTQLIVRAKDAFLSVLCRLMGWSDWMPSESRSVPDPIVDRVVAEITSDPEKFTIAVSEKP